MNTEKFEEFISQYPIFEYRILDTKDITIQERVRTICQEECERYDSTWACPPAVGTLQECEKKIKSYPQAVFFSSVAEVSDIMNMEEMLSTRRAHEDLTTEVGKYLNKEGYETYILSTESCDICQECTFPQGKPCRHPEKMHPCLESHGVVAAEIVEDHSKADEIGLNNTVELYCEDDDEVETYRIVTSVRGSSLNGLVSIESPIGKALLGHKEGDRVYIKVNDDFGYYVVIRKVIKTEDEAEDHIRSF